MEQDEKTASSFAKSVIGGGNSKMPFPASIGALVSLGDGVGGFYHNHSPPAEVLEAMKYSKTQRYLKGNLTCNLKIYQDKIPANFGKLTGVLVFETRKEILHDGIFILVKGLCLSSKKYEFAERKRIPCLKFNILPFSRRNDVAEGEEGVYNLESGRTTYTLELEKRYIKTAEDLPPPIISVDGKLLYKLQVFVTIEGKQFQVAEERIPFQGYFNLTEQFVGEGLRKEVQLGYKKGYLSRRKFADVTISCDKSGYLPGENIGFFLLTKNGDGIPLKFKVELLQKLWYQEPTKRQSERMPPSKRLSVKMKEILVTSVQKIDQIGREQVSWRGKIKVPHSQAPSYKYDFLNSISYILRLTVTVVGDEVNGCITGESTVFIGTVREGKSVVGHDANSGLEAADDAEDDSKNGAGVDIPLLLGISMMCPFGSMNSVKMYGALGRGRPRSGSTSSTLSTGSSSTTASIFRLPPSYSKLFSRRPSLETLPPNYCELELQRRSSESDDLDRGESD